MIKYVFILRKYQYLIFKNDAETHKENESKFIYNYSIILLLIA